MVRDLHLATKSEACSEPEAAISSSLATVTSFLCSVINYHKLADSKQHTFIISHFLLLICILIWLHSRCWLSLCPHQRLNQEKTCFQAPQVVGGIDFLAFVGLRFLFLADGCPGAVHSSLPHALSQHSSLPLQSQQGSL